MPTFTNTGRRLIVINGGPRPPHPFEDPEIDEQARLAMVDARAERRAGVPLAEVMRKLIRRLDKIAPGWR